MHDYMEGFPNH